MSLSRRPSTTFDASSGLSWSEQTVRATDARRRLTFRAPVSTTRSNIGCSTLQELAIRTLLSNVDAVEVGTLDGLDWEQHGSKLWSRIEAANLTTPTIWSAFCYAFPEQPLFNYYRAAELTPTRASFDEYTSFLSAPLLARTHDFCWLTALTISNLDLRRSHVIAISIIHSLVALDIHSKDTQNELVDDRIIRAWSERASQEGAFPRLRVLILRHQPHVTKSSLHFLFAFKSLMLLGIAGCGLSKHDKNTASTHGWTTEDSHNILADVQRDMDMSQTWDGALYGCVRRTKCLEDSLRAGKAQYNTSVPPFKFTPPRVPAAPSGPDPPLLSYRLGSAGHTSYSNLNTFAPLVFFRHEIDTTFMEPPDPPPTSHTSRNVWPNEGPQPKRRRMKQACWSTDVGEMLREYHGTGQGSEKDL